ncbi:SGNH/GDSL hydrolase family protein [Paenibacillus sp. LMG 31456]|uniref:SGNH/GDSL hydrolase family protein n=1 Tax=Paenibacillus foliorum TaxID=2654974 RepID=A0A972K5R6_9BACL|nr:SGNH/GDSL hydrolase family protein [Paenibacillus foliorum]NOU98273.1 SGNH/GDSL hydrolase family protein [Paenibacillus foliorum]
MMKKLEGWLEAGPWNHEANRWRGKSWGTLGDSITEANGYQPLVSSGLGLSQVMNYGKSGCTMTAGGDRDYGATVNVGRNIDPTLDCVTIFAGVNDFRLDKPLGEPDSYDILTFYGAYRTLIEHILTNNPCCRLNLWTPLPRDKDGYDIFSTNTVGRRLVDYVDAIRMIGINYSLPLLDLYAVSGFNKLTMHYYTSDGLHPNENGHQRIADLAVSFLSRL